MKGKARRSRGFDGEQQPLFDPLIVLRDSTSFYDVTIKLRETFVTKCAKRNWGAKRGVDA